MARSQVNHRRKRRVVQVITGLLLASAIARGLTEAGPAIAQISAQADTVAEAETLPDDGFLAALQAREDRVDARETALEERIAALREAERNLQDNLAALEAAEASLMATIAMAETASAADVAQLTSVYENMKPEEAAELFAEMPPAFAAGFLATMRPDMAAAILAELTPETAYAFSVVLAGRNAGLPPE